MTDYAIPYIEDNMKRIIELYKAILTDVRVVCNTSTDRDLIYIKSRLKDEGESFCTITLPSFAKDFERSLELGYFETGAFRAFRKRLVPKGSQIPAFLQGIVSKVFDDSGVIHTDVNPDHVEAVRQVCLMFNKMKKETSEKRKINAVKNYIRCESDLAKFRPKDWSLSPIFKFVASYAFGRTFADVSDKLRANALLPKHGPGAVVERLPRNGKTSNMSWSKRLERSFPFCEYGVPNYGFIGSTEVGKVSPVEVDPPVRVTFVPKTAKSPRVIAIEPCHNQYCQQALARELMAAIERDPRTSGVHFSSAESNRELARMSSMDGKYATLDLSEASDRVHAGLVVQLFDGHNDLLRAVFDCRTGRAELPIEGNLDFLKGMMESEGLKHAFSLKGTSYSNVVSLKKFSSAGSALCFPIESMVFYTICLMAGIEAENLPLTYRNLDKIKKQVCVYGDDLIVPVLWRSSLTKMLESACLKVNSGKSFSKGQFRESCGFDAFKGTYVTPVYIREQLPHSVSDWKQVVSLVSAGNQFYKKGYWFTCKYIRSFIDHLCGDLPYVRKNASLLGWHTVKDWSQIMRYNPFIHRFELKGFESKTRSKKDEMGGVAHLLNNLIHMTITSHVQTEVQDFSKSGIRGSLYRKPRWTSALY